MSHELDSAWLYIHPPLAIAGFILIFLFAFFLFWRPDRKRRIEFFGAAAWLFTFLGLLTGMLWAQSAWGSYWSWDPKETMTLLLFISLSASLVAYYEKRPKMARALAILACVLVLLTASTSWMITGLHSFA